MTASGARSRELLLLATADHAEADRTENQDHHDRGAQALESFSSRMQEESGDRCQDGGCGAGAVPPLPLGLAERIRQRDP